MKKILMNMSVACVLSMAHAKEVTWKGGGSGWGDPSNWSDTPLAGDIAVIPENVTATVKSADVDVFRTFGGYRLEAGSTIFVDAVTFFSFNAFDKPLTGSGTLLAVGGSLYLKSDNSAFDGKFVFTNNSVEVHSPTGLGTTNTVCVAKTSSGNANGQHLKIDRVDGPDEMKNNLVFTGPGSRSYVMESIKSPLTISGHVSIPSGWCQFVNDNTSTNYYNRFLGGVSGEGYLFTGNLPGNLTAIDSEVDLGGGLVAYNGGFTVNGFIRRGCLGLETKGRGFVFGAAELCNTNDVILAEWQIAKTGGFLDLNGYNQTIGNICERMDHNGVTTESDFFFTSEKPAMLTVAGTPNRRYDASGFAGCLTGAISLCYDWDGRAGIKAYYTDCTPGLFKLTSVNSTSGGIACKRGDFRIEVTATLPNLTALGVSNTGKMTVSVNGIGEEGDGLVVTVADSGVLTIGTDVTIAAKSACIGGKWIDPKPGDTYGGPESAATVKLDGLAGKGILTVAEYGGPKGFMLLFR